MQQVPTGLFPGKVRGDLCVSILSRFLQNYRNRSQCGMRLSPCGAIDNFCALRQAFFAGHNGLARTDGPKSAECGAPFTVALISPFHPFSSLHRQPAHAVLLRYHCCVKILFHSGQCLVAWRQNKSLLRAVMNSVKVGASKSIGLDGGASRYFMSLTIYVTNLYSFYYLWN